jgi:peroxiredoxin
LKSYQFLIFTIFLFFPALVKSQVTITGSNLTYAGSEIEFKINSDPFTGDETEIGKCKVDSTGNFSVVLPIKEPTYIFSHLGIYLGYMVAEPGKNYIISFPDKTGKTEANMLNPFFEEKAFQFNIKDQNKNELNALIKSFDNIFKPDIDSIAKHIYDRNIKKLIDTTVINLQKLGGISNDYYYNQYVKYNIGYLKTLTYLQKSKSISKEYFEHSPVLYNNIAYLTLFNQTFTRYFYFFGRTTKGQQIYSDINSLKSYSRLNKTLLSDSVLQNDTLRELVILKNIHDEFYAANFSRSGLLAILDSLASTTKIESHKLIASNIRKKITRLMQGFEPPQFSLYDKDGNLVSLSDLKGKYVYLNFCTCNSYSCIKEFDLLKKLAVKYKDYKLVIVTIAIDESREQMANYVNKTKLNWLFLYYGNQPDILKTYDIRAFPTYYLIGPDGKLIMSPAPSPGENFELQLFNIMRSRGDV